MTVEVEVRHKDQLRKFQVKLASLPEGLPPKELPPAHPRGKPTEGQRPKVGQIALSVPEFKNEAWAYVPEGYDPSVQHGMIAILHGSTVLDLKALLAQWKPLCDANDLILVVPKARVNFGWQTDEAAFVEKLLAKVKSAYTVDSMRVAVFGRDSGAALGLIAAYRSRELIRAAAVIDAGSMLPPPETDPEHRLAIYLGTAKTSQQAQVVAATLMRLKAMKIPVTQKDLGKEARDLTPDELAELVRWFDTLDRI